MRTRTEALLLLLRVCPRSYSRREPRRWSVVFALYAGKANSVSPVPARIAPQGGETREHRCDFTASASFLHRENDLSLPFARGERFGDFGRLYHRRLRVPALAKLAGRASRTHPPLRHTERCVLAEPFNNIKKQGWGQFFFCRFHPQPATPPRSTKSGSIYTAGDASFRAHSRNDVFTRRGHVR